MRQAQADLRALYSRFNVRYYRSAHVSAAFLFHYDQQARYGSFHGEKEFTSNIPLLSARILRSILSKVVDKVRWAADRKDRNDPMRFIYRIVQQVPPMNTDGETLRVSRATSAKSYFFYLFAIILSVFSSKQELERQTQRVLDDMKRLNLIGGRNPAGMAGVAFICAAEQLALSGGYNKELVKLIAGRDERVAEVVGVHRHTLLNRKKEYLSLASDSVRSLFSHFSHCCCYSQPFVYPHPGKRTIYSPAVVQSRAAAKNDSRWPESSHWCDAQSSQ